MRHITISGNKINSAKFLREGLSEAQVALAAYMGQQEKTFADTLARLMAEKQLTQAELATRVGVGQSAISMMLSRKCRPQPRTIGRLAEALGVPIEELWPSPLPL